jgi:hypothetical protein
MDRLKIIAGWVVVVAVIVGWSYMAERPKYHFEEVAKRVGEQLPGARLILTAKSGDITSPVSWFWPATTTYNFAMPDLGKGRFYLMALRYDEKKPTVYLIDADCERRDVDLYDLDEPASAAPARDFAGEPIVVPNGKTYRLLKYHYPAPKQWVTAFCDTDWTAERNAVFKARQLRVN